MHDAFDLPNTTSFGDEFLLLAISGSGATRQVGIVWTHTEGVAPPDGIVGGDAPAVSIFIVPVGFRPGRGI